MPELPEVETTCNGIRPHLLKQNIVTVKVRNASLRWPVPADIDQRLRLSTITGVERRAKYILLHTNIGTTLIHLGMSGSLRIVAADTVAEKHDHVDFVLGNGLCLRLRDPRRFGSVLWAGTEPLQHKLLQTLGPEPLGEGFNSELLFARSRKRKQSIKTFIMDAHVVVGVGNIYASESLFLAGIHPKRAAGSTSLIRYARLVEAIKTILTNAIERGGTTLRDFVNSEGEPGYFSQQLMVYGRADEQCMNCSSTIRQITLGQRSTFYCPGCQK